MNILQEIVEHKRSELRRMNKSSLSTLMQSEQYRTPARSLRHALDKQDHFSIIAEIKRASPTAGNMNSVHEPEEIAIMYDAAGAAAISILTDEKYFHGSIDDLKHIRPHTSLPILRKDFILDEIQLIDAKANGADAVLLIAGILDRGHLKDLYSAAREIGLEALVELYDSEEIDTIDFSCMKLIGINNRNLRNFSVDIGRTTRIASLLPPDVFVVSESGISTGSDLVGLWKYGIHAALVGECLMKSHHPGNALRKLLREFDDAGKS